MSVHGETRLGSNSLIDLVVFGRATGHRLKEILTPGAAQAPLPTPAEPKLVSPPRPLRPPPPRSGAHPPAPATLEGEDELLAILRGTSPGR
ncbi:MAG: hypothetical protein IBJ11_08335 [Phycisphaerales bacterium]|nr:hypothetical protein [Phycisphaerales bacterium]